MTDLYGQCNHCGENLTAGHSCSGMLRNRAFFDAHSVKLRPSYDAIAAERDALAARLAEAEARADAHQKRYHDCEAFYQARLTEADWLLRTLTVDDVSPEWLKRWQAWTRAGDSAEAVQK